MGRHSTRTVVESRSPHIGPLTALADRLLCPAPIDGFIEGFNPTASASETPIAAEIVRPSNCKSLICLAVSLSQ